MKKSILIVLGILVAGLAAKSQTKYNLEGGYFGENATYPGLIAGFELEQHQNARFSTPFRANIGYYNHPRSHNALFIEALYGTRRYFKSGLFIEHALGIGVMFSFYPEDVWHVGDDGGVVRVTNFANPDFSPSITFGLGYNFAKDKPENRMLWIRPKLSWQMPYNNLAQPHIALQVGYSHTFKIKD